jgi:hypothetical protein
LYGVLGRGCGWAFEFGVGRKWLGFNVVDFRRMGQDRKFVSGVIRMGVEFEWLRLVVQLEGIAVEVMYVFLHRLESG